MRPRRSPDERISSATPFAFMSKTFLDAQRGAQVDLQLLSSRAKELRSIAPSLDDWEKIKIPLPFSATGDGGAKEVTAGELVSKLKEGSRRALTPPSSKPLALDDWENIKIPLSGGKEVTAGQLVKQFQASSRLALSGSTPSRPLPSLDELQVVKRIQQELPPALSKLRQRLNDPLPALPPLPVLSKGPSPLDVSLLFPFFPAEDDLYARKGRDAGGERGKGSEGGFFHGPHPQAKRQQRSRGGRPVPAPVAVPLLKPFEGKEIVSFAEWNRAVKEHKWRLPAPPEGTSSWQPLQRMAEGLRELQGQSSSSHGAARLSSPQDALKDFLRKTNELFKCGEEARRCKDPSQEVSPLGFPELLEVLARTSGEVLGSLGVNSEVGFKWKSSVRGSRPLGSMGEERVGEACKPQEDGEWDAQGLVDAGGEVEQRLAAVMDSTGYVHKDDGVNHLGNFLVRPQLPLRRGGKRSGPEDRRKVAIVTTACLPWMTGTAVNPLLRAAYLAQVGNQDVTLLVPWLALEDQRAVYPGSTTFDSPKEQEEYVKLWLEQRVGFLPHNLKIAFYPGKFSREKRSILAVGDVTAFIPEEEADIAVLEEPEHLTWYYHGTRWTDKFRHVVGIIHTNYLEYVKREKNGRIQAALLEHVNNWMIRCYCHKVVRLSGATQNFPRSTVCNVHGVGVKFLDVGDAVAKQMEAGASPFSKGAYYLGKMVWSKGYRELVDLLGLNYDSLGRQLRVDVFGSGEDAAEVRAEAQAKGLRLQFHKGRDHADPSLHGFKVFINPSVSDVVCTTTAEALAMGKIVVCADHPSNDFFRGFPNCLMYRNPAEFVEKVKQAMAADPTPLTPEQRHLLSWEAATHRFLQSAGLEKLEVEGGGGRSSLLPAKTGSHQGQGNAYVCSSPSAAPSDPSVRRSKSSNNLHGLEKDLGAFGALSPASLSLSLPVPDLTEAVDRFLAFSHFMASGIEPWRTVAGSLPETMHVGADLSKELGLPPPWVQRPTYGW